MDKGKENTHQKRSSKEILRQSSKHLLNVFLIEQLEKRIVVVAYIHLRTTPKATKIVQNDLYSQDTILYVADIQSHFTHCILDPFIYYHIRDGTLIPQSVSSIIPNEPYKRRDVYALPSRATLRL